MARMSFFLIRHLSFHPHTRKESVMKYIINLFVIVISILPFSRLLADGTWLDEERHDDAAAIFVEHWSAKACNGDKGYTLLVVEISPADLVFTRVARQYVAQYVLDILIYDKKHELVAEKLFRDDVKVHSFDQTLQYGWNRLFSVRFQLDDGEYLAELRLTDEHTSREHVKVIPFEVHATNSFTLDVSDVLLARRNEVETEDGELVRSILPFPPKIYGAEEPRLYCYFEIYNQEIKKGDSIEYTISYVDPGNRQRVLTRKKVWYNAHKLPVMYSFETADLAPGTYRLLVEIHTESGDFQLEREKPFLVYQSPIDLRFKSYKKILEEIRLIATREEWQALQHIPPSMQQAAINDFWKRKDPTPGTVRNEVLTEFYRRINLAQRFFSRVNRKGMTLTDRGKVFVILGAPDKILRQVTDTFNRQVEVWLYQHQKLQVVFQDDFGFGDYHLIAPYTLLSDL